MESQAASPHLDVRALSVGVRRALIAGLLGASLILGVGCESDEQVPEPTVRYRPPLEHRMVVETVVDAPFAVVWEGLVGRLSASTFRIATSDRASHFLVVEDTRSSEAPRSTARPIRYVDCGRIEGSFADQGRTHEFAYDVADASRHVELRVDEGRREMQEIFRAVDLSARATLFVRPEGTGQTRLTINTRYAVSIETTATPRRVPSGVDAPEAEPRAAAPFRVEARFTTFSSAALGPEGEHGDAPQATAISESFVPPGRSDTAECRSTGQLERDLIAVASPAA